MRTAKAKFSPKAAPKTKPGDAASIRRRAEELRAAANMLREVRPVIERLEGELGIEDWQVHPSLQPTVQKYLLETVEEIESIHSLVEVAQMAVHDIEDRRAVRPMIELLEVIQGRLKSVGRQIDLVRPKSEVSSAATEGRAA